MTKIKQTSAHKIPLLNHHIPSSAQYDGIPVTNIEELPEMKIDSRKNLFSS